MNRKYVGILSVAGLLAMNSYAADSRQAALDAFNKSSAVQAELRKAAASGYEVNGAQPEAALIGGGCGFAGCDQEYFVAQAFRTRGANTQVDSVTTRVRVTSLGQVDVSLVELKQKN